jgi:hypothetical protein
MYYFNDNYYRNIEDGDQKRDFKIFIAKIYEVYRAVFKACAVASSVENLKLFAERNWCVEDSEIFYISRQFLKLLPNFERTPELGLPYMKLIVKCVRNCQHSQDNESKILKDSVMLIHILMRKFMKCPQHSDMISMLSFTFESLKIIKSNVNSSDIANQIQKLTGELYSFLRDHPDYVDALIELDSFHSFDLCFFRAINLQANLHLVPSFKKDISKYLVKKSISPLLIDFSDSESFYELYLKLEFGDFQEIGSNELFSNNALSSEIIQFEICANLFASESTASLTKLILKSCVQSYFLSDTRFHAKAMNILRLSLLSFSSDGLGDIIKQTVIPSDKFSMSSLLFLSCFPFSLWRSLQKTPVKSY